MPDLEPWVSVETVVRHLGIDRDAVCRRIDKRGVPAHRVDRLWELELGDVDGRVRTGGAKQPEAERGGVE
ncbi:MAG: DNA-binding protein [Myxococcota bacterium]|jgi:hypothetical protein|nr:DNA-binding protein [Myxococcota bacterium]